MSEQRITPSLVISILALVISIGGVSYAAVQIPKNSVGTKQLKKRSVSTAKLKNAAVTAAKLKRDSVVNGKLRGGSVTLSKLRDGSVNSAKVLDGSLLASDFSPGVIPGDTWFSSRDAPPFFDLDVGSLVTVVATPELPAGAYVISARANILGGPAASTIICSLEDDAAQNITVAASAVFPLSMSGVATVEDARPIELKCNKSAGTPQIAQAHVIATQVPQVIATDSG